MKIGNPADKPVTLPVAGGQAAAAEAAKTSAAAAGSNGVAAPADASATVALSSTASTLLSSGPGEFDAEKVGRVGDSIANGTFKVNPEAIADKLIANAQELLSKVKS